MPRLPGIWPPGTGADAKRIVAARAVRAAGDGMAALLLPLYLGALGFGPLLIGTLATASLIGSAALTVLMGLLAGRFRRRRLLFAASLLMAATGAAFAAAGALAGDGGADGSGGAGFSAVFWPLLLVSLCGTLNPTAGDASLFLPLEQTLLAHAVEDRHRTSLFARFGVAGALATACGSLATGAADWLAPLAGARPAMALLFLAYGLLGLVALAIYATLSPAIESAATREVAAAEAATRTAHPLGWSGLGPSRRRVLALTGLFALDAFGGGFTGRAVLALWLYLRFDFSASAAGALFFWVGLLATVSYLAAVPVARRIGLVNTMVFTHLPSSLALVAIPFLPGAEWAVALLVARAALAEMDVPARNSYVMAVVTEAERPAAAAVTALPRSLASAAGPQIAGFLLSLTTFGWPLLISGTVKIVYDFLLLWRFAGVRAPEEEAPRG